MAQSQALEIQQKKELTSKEEQTVPSRFFVPNTDIFETEDALVDGLLKGWSFDNSNPVSRPGR